VHDDRAQVSSRSTQLSSAQQAAYVRGGPGSVAGYRATAAAVLCDRRRFKPAASNAGTGSNFLAISHNFSYFTTDLISSFLHFSLQAQFSFKFFSLA
jgi:hypothetical protein